MATNREIYLAHSEVRFKAKPQSNNNSILLDAEIANNLVELLKSNTSIYYEKMKISVTEGFVSLNGIVEWDFQQKPIINSIGLLKGVRGVSLRMAAFK
ncbi:MAG TPA: BON domain-containing protein [Mucilaginibacter sp.]|jgi:hypothetical protein|nr:BON domain-containing protein [Mucilaginibacter sp.]